MQLNLLPDGLETARLSAESICTGYACESLYISHSAIILLKGDSHFMRFRRMPPVSRRQHVHLTGRNRVSGADGSSAVPLRNPADPVPRRLFVL